MPSDLRVEGVDQLQRVSARLKEAGDKGLKREMTKGLNRAAKPLALAAEAGALERLPKRGGLNVWVAESKITTRTRGNGRNPGVRLVAKRPKSKGTTDLNRIDQGRLRHPVYGNRRVWALQSVRPGWFTNSITDHAEQARREMVAVFDDIERRLSSG